MAAANSPAICAPHAPRWRAALAVAAAVLLLHAWLLGVLPRAPGPGKLAAAAPPLQVRQIVRVAAPPVGAGPVTEQPAPAPAPPRAREVRPEAGPDAVPPTAAAPAPEALPESAPAPGGATLPVYATRLPAPVTLQYAWRRGAARGRAELQWRPDDGRYQLALRGLGLGTPQIGWASQGGLDAAGIAPERYTESRRGRELRAANFQREAGRITFSGPVAEYALVPGAQDRLSWMIQLAAVLAANPALAVVDAQVSMLVVGTRGDADVWIFTVIALEDVEVPAGTVPGAVHLRREPRRPYDTEVETWLDPARQHLPVRTRLQVRATGEGTEYLLEQMMAP